MLNSVTTKCFIYMKDRLIFHVFLNLKLYNIVLFHPNKYMSFNLTFPKNNAYSETTKSQKKYL